MKFKVNSSIISLEDEATIKDLLDALGYSVSEIKVGFPPKKVVLDDVSVKLSDVGLRSGDKLIAVRADNSQEQSEQVAQSSTTTGKSEALEPNNAFKPRVDPGFSRNSNLQTRSDHFSVPIGDLGHLNLRIMKDDNSCLFRALGYTILNNKDSSDELRSIVANTVKSKPDVYEALLEVPIAKYPEWITKDTTWGGALEMGIIAEHFDITVCSLDVGNNRVDTFNGGALNFVMVVYSGIHYDAVASNPLTLDDRDTLQMDQTVFSASDKEQKDVILTGLSSLGQVLKQRHYYTDTANFTIKCNICKARFKGEKEAVTHANSTGHTDFREE